MRFGGERPGIRFPLRYLARENKRVDIMRNVPIVSLSTVEDTLSESPVLPIRAIKKGREDLGEILFVHPLPPTNLSACVHFFALLFSHLPCSSSC